MNQRRIAAAVFFSAVIVLVIALIVYTEQSNASQTVSVWIMTHDVSAGTIYNAADVQQVQLRAASGDFNYETKGPAELSARYTRALKARDVVRADDLVPLNEESEVEVTIQNPPPLNPGDSIDIFAGLPSGQQALVGRGITVETASGGSLTILVPLADEASWVAVGSSNVALHAARTTRGSQFSPTPLNADEAIRVLCGSACLASAPAASATP